LQQKCEPPGKLVTVTNTTSNPLSSKRGEDMSRISNEDCALVKPPIYALVYELEWPTSEDLDTVPWKLDWLSEFSTASSILLKSDVRHQVIP
jgi:hypothetical protein